MPIFHFHEGNQRGKSFGERLANAYAEVFAQGFQSAIAVGNDSPGLANTDWDTVQEKLLEGHCVLGPSLRGGAYLIGLTADGFKKSAFEKLPWQTSRLFKALSSFCQKDGPALEVLHRLHDVNSVHDLISALDSNELASSLRSILRLILANHTPEPEYRFLSEPKGLARRIDSLRAPPTMALAIA